MNVQKFKNLNLFVDGIGKAGLIESYTPPKQVAKVIEHDAGGMLAPIDIPVGLEKMDSEFQLNAIDPDSLALFGLTDGVKSITMKGVLLGDNGSVIPVVFKTRGIFKEIDMGTIKRGDDTSVKYSVNHRMVELTVGGQEIYHIDVENMIHRVGGTDQLAAERAALGL